MQFYTSPLLSQSVSSKAAAGGPLPRVRPPDPCYRDKDLRSGAFQPRHKWKAPPLLSDSADNPL